MGTGLIWKTNGVEVSENDLAKIMCKIIYPDYNYSYTSPYQRVIPGMQNMVQEESTIEENVKQENINILEQPAYEKVEGDIITPDDPEYNNILKATLKELSDYEDSTDILDPSSELRRFGPKNRDIESKVNLLTNDQVSDLFHRVNNAILPESIDRSRNINLTVAVILYILQAIEPDLLFALCRDTNAMVTVNSICRFFTGLSVFTKYDSNRPIVAIADKQEMFKIITEMYSYFKETEKNTSFKCCNDPYSFLELAMKDNFMKNGTRMTPDKQPKIPTRIPFDFIIPGISTPAKRTPTKSVINSIKTELSKISGGIANGATPSGDLVYVCFFMGKGITNSVYVDPGVIIGNGYNMFCNIPGDTILVNFKHKEIIKKTILDPSYILSVDEIKEVQKDMFMNESIYYRIDMANMSSIMKKIKTKEDLMKFGKKLSAICSINFGQFGLPHDPRLRINTFKSIDEFTLVSDEKTFSPLVDRGATASQIVHGMELKVDKDDVYLYCPNPNNGQLFECTFEINYGIF